MNTDNKIVDTCCYSFTVDSRSQSYWTSPNIERILQEWLEIVKSEEFRQQLRFSNYYKLRCDQMIDD